MAFYKLLWIKRLFLGKITSGTVVVKGNIRQFTESSIIFEDGFELKDVDEVVMATGYWFDFPHLDSGRLVPVKENKCKLYKKMFPLTAADKNTLAVIGLLQVSVFGYEVLVSSGILIKFPSLEPIFYIL